MPCLLALRLAISRAALNFFNLESVTLSMRGHDQQVLVRVERAEQVHRNALSKILVSLLKERDRPVARATKIGNSIPDLGEPSRGAGSIGSREFAGPVRPDG